MNKHDRFTMFMLSLLVFVFGVWIGVVIGASFTVESQKELCKTQKAQIYRQFTADFNDYRIKMNKFYVKFFNGIDPDNKSMYVVAPCDPGDYSHICFKAK